MNERRKNEIELFKFLLNRIFLWAGIFFQVAAASRYNSGPWRADSTSMNPGRPSSAPNSNYSMKEHPIYYDVFRSLTPPSNRTFKEWKRASSKHRKKFELLSKVWKSWSRELTIINDNIVCFQKDFLIGSGSYGTEVYVCLGSDGIERGIKRLPKVLCNLLKNERDILTSQNAVKSPRVINYHFYDNTSSPDFGYLILDLYEQNLEEYVKKEGEKITESRARKMIRQVLEGLKALHAREPRIIHRDLKPTNILVDVNGDLVLSDFGIGRFFPEQGILLRCKHCTIISLKYTNMTLLDLWQFS